MSLTHRLQLKNLANSKYLVWLISFSLISTGILTVVRPIAERLPEKISDVVMSLDLQSASYLFVGFGLSLIYLGYEILQRKRAAWWLASFLVILSLLLHTVVNFDLGASITALLVLIILLVAKVQFNSKLHSDNLWQGVRLLLASTLFALAYGTLGFWLLDRRDFGIVFSFGESLTRTLRSYLLIGNNDLKAHSVYGRWFLHSLAIVGAMSLAYGVFSIFRPLQNRFRTLPTERAKARALLNKYGGETDDFFKLWPQDKSYLFSNDNQAFVAYGVARGVAVCFAGPSGNPKSISRLVKQYKAFCLQNGWLPVFVQTTDKFGEQLEAEGFSNLLIGADAIIDLDRFVSQTAHNKYFRNIANRFERLDYSTQRYLPPHSPQLIKEVKNVSDDWLKRAGRKQWRFFTGYFANKYFQQTNLFVARDKTGCLMAFVNELPSFKKDETTIDLMRHRQKAPTNIMDFLFIQLMKTWLEQGYKKFNMGLSPLGAKKFADSPADKLLGYIYSSNQKIISFKGLHRYKEKFEPDWEPRYLYYYGSAARLPQIGLAVVKLIKY